LQFDDVSVTTIMRAKREKKNGEHRSPLRGSASVARRSGIKQTSGKEARSNIGCCT